MDSQYCYAKKRWQFGKCCHFSERDKIEVDIKSDASLGHNFIRMDPVTQGTQCNKIYASHEVTEAYKLKNLFFCQNLQI